MTYEAPAVNHELFQKVLDQIKLHPEGHEQATYENSCGTTRCVAGWALHLHNPTQPIEHTAQDVTGNPFGSYSAAARQLLGLTREEAEELFLDTMDNDEAVRITELYALKGREWRAQA